LHMTGLDVVRCYIFYAAPGGHTRIRPAGSGIS
jgi:hypothetical protein